MWGGRGAGNLNLSPRMGSSLCPPPHPEQESGLTAPDGTGSGWRADHPCFPSCVRGGLAPRAPPSPILAWFRFIQIKQLSPARVQTCCLRQGSCWEGK